MRYRFWDTDINHYFGLFDTEEEALALVRTLVGAYGAAYADDLSLGREDDDGSRADPISGAALIVRAEEVAARLDPVSARPAKAIASNPRKVAVAKATP